MRTQKGNVFFLTLCCALLFVSMKAEAYGLLFYLFGAEAKICVTVVDADGKPVENALTLATYRQYNWGLVNNVERLADANGYAELVGRCDDLGASVHITKEGYYKTMERKAFVQIGGDIKVQGGKWQPYGAHRTYVLKEIRNPVPMVVFWPLNMRPPELCKEFGYDLEYGDYVKPYGDGEVADFFVKFEWDEDDKRKIKTMTMTFPNALDGAYICSYYEPSELKSPYRADEEAQYLKEFVFSKTREKDPKEGYWRIVSEEQLAEDRGLILRTRTKVDANGTLVSAHYSKIYGRFAIDGQSPETMGIVGGVTTYFNPVENDTNLECDGKSHRELRKGKRENKGKGSGESL
ncbi:MAG: hypothetical protein MJ202_06000 [Lentisphaeria bacterium]|nr:hypothetical protein [Lentisphaeria bacterium]